MHDLIDTIGLNVVTKGAGPIVLKINELVQKGKKIIVIDAVSKTDLEQIALAIEKCSYDILPCGSAGLANALSNIGEEKSNEEIAKELEVPIYDVINALESLKEPISMFEPIYNDGGDTIYLYDQIEDKTNSSSEISTKLAIASAIENLSSREKYILDERFITGKTQMEIAEELNISQAQVSRLEKGAIKQLKKVLK